MKVLKNSQHSQAVFIKVKAQREDARQQFLMRGGKIEWKKKEKKNLSDIQTKYISVKI